MYTSTKRAQTCKLKYLNTCIHSYIFTYIPMGRRTNRMSDQWIIGPKGVGPTAHRTNGPLD